MIKIVNPEDDKALFVRGDVRFETEGENDHGLHVEGDTKIVGDHLIIHF